MSENTKKYFSQLNDYFVKDAEAQALLEGMKGARLNRQSTYQDLVNAIDAYFASDRRYPIVYVDDQMQNKTHHCPAMSVARNPRVYGENTEYDYEAYFYNGDIDYIYVFKHSTDDGMHELDDPIGTGGVSIVHVDSGEYNVFKQNTNESIGNLEEGVAALGGTLLALEETNGGRPYFAELVEYKPGYQATRLYLAIQRLIATGAPVFLTQVVDDGVTAYACVGYDSGEEYAYFFDFKKREIMRVDYEKEVTGSRIAIESLKPQLSVTYSPTTEHLTIGVE